MKNFLKSLTKREIVFSLMSFVVGVFLSLYIFSLLVPSGEEMIRLYHIEKGKVNNLN